MPQAIHESGGIVVEIRVWLVGFELVKKSGKIE